MLTPHSDFSFIHLVDARARAHPDAVYASCGGEQLTFAALRRGALRWQRFFEDRGLTPGDRVGLMLTNSFDAIVIVFALLRAGLVWVPINPGLRGPNLEYLVDHAQPRVVIAESTLAESFAGGELAPGALLVTRTAASRFSVELPDAVPNATTGRAGLPSSTPAVLMYTSGTTGPPKGILVSHAMLRVAAEGGLVTSRGGDGDVFFYWESMGHIGGAQVLLFPLLRDIRLAMVPRFSASRFWEQVREAGATHIHYLGGILQMLLNQEPDPRDREHPVRMAWGGGCSPQTFRAFQRRFGVPLHECYGMTEASSIVTVADGSVPGSVGRPLPWIRVSILDDRDRPVDPGEPGEIVLETDVPQAFFSGYVENPEATEETLREGKLHTGDLGSLDSRGNLFYLGRITESLRCRGENVSSWEVEHVIMGHPSVNAAAVIGVDASVGEQDIMVFVEFAAEDPPGYRELVDWLEPRLAKYQLPRYFKTVSEFERTPSQRIKKHQLDSDPATSWDRLAS